MTARELTALFGLVCMMALLTGPVYADDWPEWRGTGRLGIWNYAFILDAEDRILDHLYHARHGRLHVATAGTKGQFLSYTGLAVVARSSGDYRRTPGGVVDRPHRLAGHPVEDVQKRLLARLVNRLDRPSIHGDVRQDLGTGHIEAPDRVVDTSELSNCRARGMSTRTFERYTVVML